VRPKKKKKTLPRGRGREGKKKKAKDGELITNCGDCRCNMRKTRGPEKGGEKVVLTNETFSRSEGRVHSDPEFDPCNRKKKKPKELLRLEGTNKPDENSIRRVRTIGRSLQKAGLPGLYFKEKGGKRRQGPPRKKKEKTEKGGRDSGPLGKEAIAGRRKKKGRGNIFATKEELSISRSRSDLKKKRRPDWVGREPGGGEGKGKKREKRCFPTEGFGKKNDIKTGGWPFLRPPRKKKQGALPNRQPKEKGEKGGGGESLRCPKKRKKGEKQCPAKKRY